MFKISGNDASSLSNYKPPFVRGTDTTIYNDSGRFGSPVSFFYAASIAFIVATTVDHLTLEDIMAKEELLQPFLEVKLRQLEVK